MPSLRKTACEPCTAAKRRCDKGYPACQRCSQRSLKCWYLYLPKSTTLQTKEEGQVPGSQAATANNVLSLFDSDGSMILPYPCADLESISNLDLHLLEPTPLCKRVLDFWPRTSDIETWHFCGRTLLSYADKFVGHGFNSFIHPPQVNGLRPPLQTAFGVCAAYKARSEATLGIFEHLLNTEIDRLGKASLGDSVAEQLAGLQAMILYHILMLFGGNIRHQYLAEQREGVLAQWTAKLEAANSLATYDTAESWALYESARRSVMISYLLRGVYHVLKYRVCYLISNLVSLPVSPEPLSGWHASSPRSLVAGPNSTNIVSYHEFVKMWEDGRISNTDEFGQLLLVACKGVAPVREFFLALFSDH